MVVGASYRTSWRKIKYLTRFSGAGVDDATLLFFVHRSQLSQAGLYVFSVDGLHADCSNLRSDSLQFVISAAHPVFSRLLDKGSVHLEVGDLFGGLVDGL